MTILHRSFIFAIILLAAPLASSQASDPAVTTAITQEIKTLRSLDATQRPLTTIKVAHEVASLPPGLPKVILANMLASLVTEGDQGQDALQAVATTLAKALAEFPLPAKDNQPQEPYLELASLVRYKQVTVTLDDPLFARASQILISNEADVAKADFTLTDLHNKKVTLSQLRGKVVLVNFWATWCPPCRAEIPDLDKIYTRFKPHGLVILSISDEDAAKVNSFISKNDYHPPVLIDADDAVHKRFHVEGIPKTFIFDRDGRLAGETIDQCTGKQFLALLSKTDLHP